MSALNTRLLAAVFLLASLVPASSAANGVPFQDIQQQINSLDQRITNATFWDYGRLQTLENNMSYALGRIGTLQNQTRAMNQSIGNITERLYDAQNRIVRLQDNVSGLKNWAVDSFFDIFFEIDIQNKTQNATKARLDNITPYVYDSRDRIIRAENNITGLKNWAVSSFFDVFAYLDQLRHNTSIIQTELLQLSLTSSQNFSSLYGALYQEASERKVGDDALNASINAKCQDTCIGEYALVCGTNGKTYLNQCEAGRAGTGILHGGICAQCSSGLTDCNGACVDTNTDGSNCGSCGSQCGYLEACVAGTCQPSCTPASEMCNGRDDDCDGMVDDGAFCPSNPNEQGACVQGTCVSTCNFGYANCDANAQNGCETGIYTDPLNCGGCGSTCTTPHGTPACTAGACTINICDSGYYDCNNQPGDGCEAQTATDPSNCGRCGNVCFSGSCDAGWCLPIRG